MRISVDAQDPMEGLAELASWLGQEPELRGLVTDGDGAPAAGTLGVASDVLVVAAGSGGALSVLAASLKSFLSLPRRSDIRIVLTSARGQKLEIDAKRVADVEALVREIFGDGG